ncbi:MAG: N-acetyltransferase [Terrisporobacter sp.]|uniref:GNAT family N-acetyltransferase n=1 Tax=Terrisporobacter sp. TaxID=1965305 RepID=UPI002FC9CD92
MTIHIRQEELNDNHIVYDLIKSAFESAEHSDGDEQNLVNRLRTSESFIPELSLVAVENDTIIGHILFTKLFIADYDTKYESLGLAPLAVSPDHQNKGVGGKLINEGLKVAKELGYRSAIVLGSEKYYPRFGFLEAKNFEIKPPFEVPSENFMAIELVENSLENVNGIVVYPKEFFEQ